MTVEITGDVVIVTSFHEKPIENRNFDWCASLAGDFSGELIGWGATEADAKGDLLGKLVARRLKAS